MINSLYKTARVGYTSRANLADALIRAFYDRPMEGDGELLAFLEAESLSKFIAVLRNEPEHRVTMQNLYEAGTPRTPPRKVFLDHVPKTGGLLIYSILKYLYPLHVVTPHRDVWSAAEPPTEEYSSTWPIVAGHVGRRHHYLIPDRGERLRCTVVRDPVSWMRSIYSYWRHVIVAGSPDFELPLVRKARLLSFSEFIHDPECQSALINFQTAFLKPLRSDSIEEIFHYYDLVGTSQDIPGFLRRLFALAGIESPLPIEKLIEITPPNASPPTPISDEDRLFITRLWADDHRLYELAKEKWAPPAAA
jgi:hypothetical protein